MQNWQDWLPWLLLSGVLLTAALQRRPLSAVRRQLLLLLAGITGTPLALYLIGQFAPVKSDLYFALMALTLAGAIVLLALLMLTVLLSWLHGDKLE